MVENLDGADMHIAFCVPTGFFAVSDGSPSSDFTETNNLGGASKALTSASEIVRASAGFAPGSEIVCASQAAPASEIVRASAEFAPGSGILHVSVGFAAGSKIMSASDDLAPASQVVRASAEFAPGSELVFGAESGKVWPSQLAAEGSEAAIPTATTLADSPRGLFGTVRGVIIGVGVLVGVLLVLAIILVLKCKKAKSASGEFGTMPQPKGASLNETAIGVSFGDGFGSAAVTQDNPNFVGTGEGVESAMYEDPPMDDAEFEEASDF
jgi:hypothetical protein